MTSNKPKEVYLSPPDAAELILAVFADEYSSGRTSIPDNDWIEVVKACAFSASGKRLAKNKWLAGMSLVDGMNYAIKKGWMQGFRSYGYDAMKLTNAGWDWLAARAAPQESAPIAGNDKKPFVATDLQKSILYELDGNAMTRKSLADNLKQGAAAVGYALTALRKAGWVKNKRGRGYFRTDKPPNDLDSLPR